MADLFRSCPDGHRCENGALCAESMEGSYYCDCPPNFAGLSCEFGAETFCQASQETTSTYFCTNGGTCVRRSSWTCDCPPEYDGPHCEYIAGSKPSDWPTGDQIKKTPANEKDMEAWVMAVIIIVSCIVGLMLGFMVWRSIRRRREDKEGAGEDSSSFRRAAGQNAPKDQSEALQIDMDGSGFRDSVLVSTGGTKTTDNNFTFEVDSEVGTPKMAEAAKYRDDPPPPPPPPSSGNNGNSARQSWGGQML